MISPTHFGDPCIHCSTPHDEVKPGPCTGDMSKAVPIAWCSMGVRWDNVERYRYRMSNGVVRERYAHISFSLPYYHFGYSDNLVQPMRYDKSLRSASHAK